MSDDHFEPVRGLPAGLPGAEVVLWQGSPQWRSLARSAYRVDVIAGYFALMLVLQFVASLSSGGALGAAVAGLALPAALAALALGVLLLLAYLSARATVYTITTRRVVIRGGIALQLSLNVPFTLIDRAALRMQRDGTGDIPLELAGGSRVGYLVNWPNVRPWRFARPQPMLRAIESPQAVGEILIAAVGEVVAGVAPPRGSDGGRSQRPDAGRTRDAVAA